MSVDNQPVERWEQNNPESRIYCQSPGRDMDNRSPVCIDNSNCQTTAILMIAIAVRRNLWESAI
jgi:hypothetical protein